MLIVALIDLRMIFSLAVDVCGVVPLGAAEDSRRSASQIGFALF
jgi:hypothetical protein